MPASGLTDWDPGQAVQGRLEPALSRAAVRYAPT